MVKQYLKINMKIAKKAYRVWVHSMIGEYPVFSVEQVEVVYADNATAAKKKCEYWNEHTNEFGERAKWIDIKCKRVPESDLFDYKGTLRTKRQIDVEKVRDKRNERLMSLDENDMYYVQDARSYVGNCVLWHGLKNSGYVCGIKEAHKYTKQEIVAQFIDGRDTDIIWSAKHIEQHIKQAIDVQNISKEFSI